DMYGPMSGASAWMMTPRWDVPHLLLLWAMWAVMMTGMMLPSTAPVLLVYALMARRSAQGPVTLHIYLLALGYLAVWFTFSVGATVLQGVLAAFLVITPMMEITNAAVSGFLLLMAGVYQLMPPKHACLRWCQSPFGFLMTRWRSGSWGAFRMGIE